MQALNKLVISHFFINNFAKCLHFPKMLSTFICSSHYTITYRLHKTTKVFSPVVTASAVEKIARLVQSTSSTTSFQQEVVTF